jgi:hypothetical protein
MIVQYAADQRDDNAQGVMQVGDLAFLDLATGEVYARCIGQTQCDPDISGCRRPIATEAALLAWAGKVVAAKNAAVPHADWIFHVADEHVFGWQCLQARAKRLAASADADTAADLHKLVFDRAQIRRLLPLAVGYKMGTRGSDSANFFQLMNDKFRLKYPGYMEGGDEAKACAAGSFHDACQSAQAKVRMFKAALGVFASNPWGARGWSMGRQRLFDFIYSPIGFWGGVVLALVIGFNAVASAPESVRKLEIAFAWSKPTAPTPSPSSQP